MKSTIFMRFYLFLAHEPREQTAGGHARRWYECLLGNERLLCCNQDVIIEKSDLKNENYRKYFEGSAVENIFFYKFPFKSQAPTKVKMEKEKTDEAPEFPESSQVHMVSLLQLSVRQQQVLTAAS